MGSFVREFGKSLVRGLSVALSLLLALIAIQQLTESKDWPWLVIVLGLVIVAQWFACFEFWRRAQEWRPRVRLVQARLFIDEIRDEGAELKATIQEDPPRIKPQSGPRESVQEWIERAGIILESIRGEPARNALMRIRNSFGTTGSEWNRRTCREVLDSSVGFLTKVYTELDESKIRTDWDGERPTPRT